MILRTRLITLLQKLNSGAGVVVIVGGVGEVVVVGVGGGVVAGFR